MGPSDEHGDRPRPLPVIPELENAINLTERREDPSWDYDVSDILFLSPFKHQFI